MMPQKAERRAEAKKESKKRKRKERGEEPGAKRVKFLSVIEDYDHARALDVHSSIFLWRAFATEGIGGGR